MTTPKRATQRRAERLYQVIDPATGEPRDVPGASSLTKVLAAPGLERWKLGQVAEAILERGITDKEQAVRSIYAGSSTANLGTEIHAAIEAWIAGNPYDEMCKGAVRRFSELVTEHELVFHGSERTVAHGTIGYAGTLDHLVEHDGTMKILDVKTGKGVYPEVAVQLAALAYAEGWLEADGTITPFDLPIDRELALVAHVPQESATADLIPVRLDQTWPVVEALVGVWRWEKRNKLAVGDPLASVLGQRRTELLRRARALPDDLAAELRGQWPDPHLKLKERAGWTAASLDEVEALLRPLELTAWDRKSDDEKAEAVQRGHLPLERQAGKERIQALAERGRALHAATRAKLDEQAVEAGLPHFGLYNRWTPEQADLVESWIVEAEAAAAKRATKRASKKAAAKKAPADAVDQADEAVAS